jgi:hypothetical protein
MTKIGRPGLMPAPDFSAMLRWPNVPACYGWLSLDRRGRWRLRGEALGHAGLNDFLNRQYAHDQDGNYFVQNGPQRVFVELEYTPWVLRLVATDRLETHTGEDVSTIRGAALDDEGNLLIEIPEGIALLCDRDLPALRDCLHLPNGESADDASLFEIIARPASWPDRADPRLGGPACAGGLDTSIRGARTLWLRSLATSGDGVSSDCQSPGWDGLLIHVGE